MRKLKKDVQWNFLIRNLELNSKGLLFWMAKLKFIKFSGGNVNFFTDTINLKHELEKIMHKNFQVLPIPIVDDITHCKMNAEKKEMSISYLGDARIEKGFLLLPEVIKNLHQDNRDYRFLIRKFH